MGLSFSYAMANMLLDPLVGARTLREMPGGQGYIELGTSCLQRQETCGLTTFTL